jgi:hypothetical protein
MAFLLLGALAPTLFLAFTGTPAALGAWVILFIGVTVWPRSPT